MSELNKLIAALGQPSSAPTTVYGVRGSATAFLLAQAAEKSRRALVCIVPTEEQALNLVQDLTLFTEVETFHLPAYEIPPYTPLSPDNRTTATRLSTLYRLLNTTPPFILVASGEALLRRVLPREILNGLAELVIQGEETNQERLLQQLTRAGYDRLNMVQSVGEFSVRGDIVDIFGAGMAAPLRFDFYGDLVESIRYFDPITQRSIEEVEEAILLPVSDILFPDHDSPDEEALYARIRAAGKEYGWKYDELERIMEKTQARQRFPGLEFLLPLFYPAPSTALEYLPANPLLFLLDPHGLKQSIDLSWERIDNNFQEASQAALAVLPPPTLFLPGEELRQRYAQMAPVSLVQFTAPESDSAPPASASRIWTVVTGNHLLLKQSIELQRQKLGLLAPLATQINTWLDSGDEVHIACRSLRHANHLAEMFSQYQLPVIVLDSGVKLLPPAAAPQLHLHGLSLSEGFDLPDAKLHILSESELFGERRLGPAKKKKSRPASPGVTFEELNLGDIVVHYDHGLGVYDGITNITRNGIANDFLQIIYLDNDKLYVPIDRINTVSKYNGLSDKEPKISKLGAKNWVKTKKKVQEAVWKVAQELLELYAHRKMEIGHAFSPPDELYSELEESFPYDETPGQIQAINDVLADLTSEQVMDRLVCGDVGFGKTEVAVRAAFKVVTDNHQVAILVPTTVLAEQHLKTFRERLAGFPVTIESLNRFRSAASQKRIIQELAAGRIDIVIGTHRLLSKDVAFRRLGLIIIDEEHRFGVTHKEKLKMLRTKVDVMTLTATPIPRTLQLSLLGVRDLSIINSPPQYRRSVKTFVAQYDDLVIKEAVLRELQRGGQVFLIHNRVHTIHEMAAKVQKLAPGARVAVAHGQMPGHALEEIMVSFIKKEVDVLICTTIVESGLDIPNANTIIITRADRMGLAGIYQLRGRVGRSSEQAYAYLLVPSLEEITKDAKQRLQALMDYNELGGGFKLAMSDLQIRGGGNILGESQSGTIAAVGYDLYLDLLQKTVEDLKRGVHNGEGTVPSEEVEPEINLRLSAFLAESYIADPGQRYVAYRRLTSLVTEEELLDLQDEFKDRYGALPPEAENLFAVVTVKQLLKNLKISKLEQGPANLVFTFENQTPISPQKLLLYVQHAKKKARFTPEGKLVVETGPLTPEAVLPAVKKVLHAIQ